MASPLRLKNKVQDYAWGGFSYIPNLINRPNPSHEPFAELWMGTHHRGESEVSLNGQWTPISQYIATAPESILGVLTAQAFDNQLPYLFKILDVNAMLSIQAHPTKEVAIAGFERENKAGISLTAKHRNYKDDNHKPEIMIALTDFWLLHGFQSIEGIKNVLNNVPEFYFLKSSFTHQSIYDLYKTVMELPQEKVNEVLEPLFQRLNKLSNIPKSSADYWAKRGFEQHTHNGNYDRGIFSVYFYNLVFLKKGQAIYQAANVPHAYLEGVNVELMANSDNVFRGGLTVKHVDVNELLSNLIFESVTPQIMEGEQVSDFEKVYKTIAPDFEVSAININKEQVYQSQNVNSPEILIFLEGSATVNEEKYQKGESFFVPAHTVYSISADENCEIYKATVPF